MHVPACFFGYLIQHQPSVGCTRLIRRGAFAIQLVIPDVVEENTDRSDTAGFILQDRAEHAHKRFVVLLLRMACLFGVGRKKTKHQKHKQGRAEGRKKGRKKGRQEG
jgi:hypothetical protein